MAKKLKFHVTKNNIFINNKASETSDVEKNSSQEGYHPDEDNEKLEKEFEEPEEETLVGFVYEQLDKFFVNHIPLDSIKDMRSNYLYFFGTVAHLISILMFVYFVYDNYEQSTQQAYIALSTSGADCNSVPIAVTGAFLADYNGNWAGTPAYQESKALYSLSLSNFQISSISQYENMMMTFYHDLTEVGDVARQNNLAENLIYWMTYTDYYYLEAPQTTNFSSVGYGQLQSLEMTADPSIVFNLVHNVARFSSVAGVCEIDSYTTYDEANHYYTTTYQNYTQFIESPLCRTAVNPFTFGYYPASDGNYFTILFHVQALAVAMGVNYGIIPFSDMRVVSSTTASFSFQKVEYSIGEYFNVRYPTMETLFCVKNLTEIPLGGSGLTQLCVLTVGSTMALPVFNQNGVSLDRPIYCDCGSVPIDIIEDDIQFLCSQFDFLAGLVFYPTTDQLTENELNNFLNQRNSNVTNILDRFGLTALLKTLAQYETYQQFNKAAFNASWITTSNNYTCDEECLQSAFQFCIQPGTNTTCSLAMFNVANGAASTVSEYKYQLTNGSCTSSMVVPLDNWMKLVNNPPVQFTQTYYECYQSSGPAFVTAVGVASGNVQIFVPIVMFGLLPFLYFVLVAVRQVPPKEEYRKDDKQIAVEILGLLLLRIRDGKTRGIKRNGVLQALAKELISAAKEEGGYPDSDDEDEDDEDGGGGEGGAAGNKLKKPISNRDSLISDDGSVYPEAHAIRPSAVRQSAGGRRSSAKTRVARPGHRGRLKMDLFTQQLKPSDRPRGSEAHYRPSSDRYLQRKTSTVPDGNRETELTTQLTRNTTNLARTTTNNSTPPPTDSHRQRKNSSIFGYFFGETPEPEQEKKEYIPRINGKRILDADLDVIPSEIQVLNEEPDVYDYGKKLSNQEFELLLEDLFKYFTEALSQVKRFDHHHEQNDRGTENPMREVSVDSRDSSHVVIKSNRDIPAFKQGKELSKRLIRVNFDEFFQMKEASHFLRLSNVMCMHASVELDCEMKLIATQYAKRIAYNIGGKILTANDLNHIL